MVESVHVILIVSFAVLILVLVLVLILRRCFYPKNRTETAVSDAERGANLQNGIARLHQVSPHHHDGSNKPNNYFVVRKGVSSEPLIFSWEDHPSLVTDAVENGWSRFAFTTFTSSPSVKSAKSILGACAAGAADRGSEINNVEIGWEVCEGSADYMQKVRLNPGLKKIITGFNSSTAAVSVIRTALPLPGPHLGSALSFPQEAYFEITILAGDDEDKQDHLDEKGTEGEKVKLIEEDFNAKNSPDCSLNDVRSSHSERRKKIEIGGKQSGKNEAVLVSVGLTGGGALPLKIPGSFPGSVGFNSTGSVYLDGTKFALESKKDEWRISTEKVIGCGYNPAQKRVFFTVDSQLVHEINCKTDEFASPLYPTIAANTDIMVLVNLGQSSFKYAPANLQRTPNPCFFISNNGNSPVLGYDDSRELFSMGRIDSQWLQRNATRSNNNTVNSIRSLEFDQESEGDLFEIVLDRSVNGRSPYNT